MSLDRHELFQKLLEQLQLKDKADEKYFLDAKIDKLEIHKKSNIWQFDLQFNQIMPFDTFSDFYNRIKAVFDQIANVKVKINVENPQINNRLLGDYWHWILKHNSTSLSPSLIQELCEGVPKLKDGRINFLAKNDIVKNFLTQKALGPIEKQYQNVGFPKFNIHTFVDENQSQAKIKEFQAAREQRDVKLAKKATDAIKTAEDKRSKEAKKHSGPLMIGKQIDSKQDITQMKDIVQEERSVTVRGYIFDKEVRTLRSNRQLLILEMTDYTSSIEVKKFSRNENDEAQFDNIQEGSWVKIRGSVREDSYTNELTLNAYDINPFHHEGRKDTAKQKRVELHLHTNMSQMDATNDINDFVKRAKEWGQPALAVTDHAAVQAFPAAFKAGQKHHLKIIYGLEANVVDDGIPITYNTDHRNLKDSTYVVFDTETTGLSGIYDRVIELSAVKMHHNDILDQFEEFIDPGFPLSDKTTQLTSITDEMVKGSKSEEEVFKEFKDFCGDNVIVGHNVTFDIGFMNHGYKRHGMSEVKNPIIDTLTLARFLYPHFGNYRLDTLTKKFHVTLTHHHRAISDATSTGRLNYLFIKDAEKRYNIKTLNQLNDHMTDNDAYKHARPFHVVLLAKNQTGLKNMFKLVSISHINYFYRVPRIPRSQLSKYRKGILVGSACHSGEVFIAMMQKGIDVARKRAKFYDYLEVQPQANYAPLLESHLIHDKAHLYDIIKKMVKIGKELKKPVVATGDAHYLDPHDYIYRKILIHSQGGANRLNRETLPKVPFRTTNEMLDDFNYLGKDIAKKIVVDNTQEIANQIGDVHPIKDHLYTPHMDGAENKIKKMTVNTAHNFYGNPLPKIVKNRLDLELNSIIKNGFSVIYLIAQRLVAKSNKDGYLVGSRGSVGSSLVATMAGITEVNPLPPHYRCPKCQYSHFFTKGEYSSGFDLPHKKCPKCGTLMIGDGHNIPFQTFLGFKGDKVPDIDLNFSGDYQPIAHNYMKVLFGEKNVYRAGTIGTVADKTAYGYTKAYERDTDQELRNAETDRLAKGDTGVKRTTGQHPAGIIIVPNNMDIFDFTPIQYPANDSNTNWKTTHFDFHSIHDNMLKMDILGHDDPTMIRKLQDLSGIEPKSIPVDDPEVMKIFSGPKVLGVSPKQIFSKTGTLGVPEFGTRFVRGMLEETHPKKFSELLQISGLSHGTGVWLDNAEELIKNGVVDIAHVIGCRDNIMTDLIQWGVKSETSFQVMESVRHGRGIDDNYMKELKAAKVPDWYIKSCLKIQYMFPRAHAAAYVLMALRIAYFKVYFPLIYYSAYFSIRADEFDIVAMCSGKDAVKKRIKEINAEGSDASVKDKNLLTVLELANEMQERGFDFKMIDLKRSDASEWIIDGNKLIAPFNSAPGLGSNVAKQIVAARADKPFISKEDLSKRGKVSQKLIQFMTENGTLKGLPDKNQLSLFDM